MSALTREERETVLLLNDLGEITIHTTSPSWTRKLQRRLGAPTRLEGDCAYWEGLTTDTLTFKLPARRRAPRQAPATITKQRERRR